MLTWYHYDVITVCPAKYALQPTVIVSHAMITASFVVHVTSPTANSLCIWN